MGLSGRLFTLIRAYDRSSQASFFGVPTTVEVYANQLIAGFHSEDADPLVSQVSVEFQHLTEWFGLSGISQDTAVSHPNIGVRHHPVDPMLLYEDDLFAITLDSGAGYSIGRHRFSLEEKVWFSLTAKTPTVYSQFERFVRACGDLLSIATMTYCRAEEITLIPPRIDGQRHQSGTLHAIARYKAHRGAQGATGDTLFSFASIQPRAAGIFASWLARETELRDARALYIEGVYGRGFVEHKLLALTQGAEALHRRLYDGHFMPDEAFQTQVLAPMVSAIPNGINSQMRDALAKRLVHSNERSLRSRMNEMVREYRSALSIMASDPRRLVKPIVDTRNEFTHFPVPSPDASVASRPPAERVLFYNWFLRLLLDALFLRAMGFSHEETTKLLAESIAYRKVAEHLRPHLPVHE